MTGPFGARASRQALRWSRRPRPHRPSSSETRPICVMRVHSFFSMSVMDNVVTSSFHGRSFYSHRSSILCRDHPSLLCSTFWRAIASLSPAAAVTWCHCRGSGSSKSKICKRGNPHLAGCAQPLFVRFRSVLFQPTPSRQ